MTTRSGRLYIRRAYSNQPVYEFVTMVSKNTGILYTETVEHYPMFNDWGYYDGEGGTPPVCRCLSRPCSKMLERPQDKKSLQHARLIAEKERYQAVQERQELLQQQQQLLEQLGNKQNILLGLLHQKRDQQDTVLNLLHENLNKHDTVLNLLREKRDIQN
jgi:hypothetical protein